MSMKALNIASYDLVIDLQNKSLLRQKSPVLFLTQISCSVTKNGSVFPGKQSFSMFITRHSRTRPRNLAVYATGIPPEVTPLPPPPAGPPSNSWRNWILGMVITLILPFFTHKWGHLQTILKRIDRAVETAEKVVEEVEAVAEKVDKVAEEISDDLPEGTKLRKAADLVEDVAEKIAKDAHLAENIIDKVEELEEKVESLIETVNDHQPPKAAKEQNPNSNA